MFEKQKQNQKQDTTWVSDKKSVLRSMHPFITFFESKRPGHMMQLVRMVYVHQ
jgi:hypothetical protein